MKGKLIVILFYLSIVLPIIIVMRNMPIDDWRQNVLLCLIMTHEKPANPHFH